MHPRLIFSYSCASPLKRRRLAAAPPTGGGKRVLARGMCARRSGGACMCAGAHRTAPHRTTSIRFVCVCEGVLALPFTALTPALHCAIYVSVFLGFR